MSRIFGGQDEQTFIERIRQSLGVRTGASPVEAYPFSRGGDEQSQASKSAGDDGEIEAYEARVQLFTQALEAVGGKVRRAQTVEGAYAIVVRELQSRGISHVLIGGGDWPEGTRSSLETMLTETGLQFDSWDELAFDYESKDRAVEKVDRWEVGIDYADYGVAEHGSIAIVASERQSRSVSLLPPIHIAFLSGERLLTRRRSVLAQVSQEQKASDRPLSLTFITGPSRSSDIEMDLSIGVHGPGETMVVLIDPVAGLI